ncbi:MAG TPA: MBL fold metallo-hydrolase [Terriglobales bacterium]|nr:MBL fold metallo-hydrolase [Terriglobales bacterium]
MSQIYEIAPDVYRFSIYVPEINLAFNHFVVKDDEPLLFHTGSRAMFPALKEMVAKVIDPAKIRWIGFSHFETDECGALNHWLQVAPNATPVHGMIGCLVNLNDFSDRIPKMLNPDETLSTGKYRYRFVHTPQLPHGWDAGVLFEESQRTLFCSDLFHQEGDVEPMTTSDIIGRCRQVLTAYQKSPLANYIPYTPVTGRLMEGVANLNPRTLAIMHGSSFSGNGAQAVRDLSALFKEVLGTEATAQTASSFA